MSESEPERKVGVINPKNYYNVNQYRLDLWSYLKEQSQLVEKGEKKASIDNVSNVIRVLKIVESFWAFPGPKALMQLEKLLELENMVQVHQLSSDILRSLSSESYKHKAFVPPSEDLLVSEHEEPTSTNSKSHYFEVLFVDDISPEEENELRDKFAAIKEEEDQFRYEIIFARSFQDALVALLFNYNIQSVVIRYEVPYQSEKRLDCIKPFSSALFKQDLSKKKHSQLTKILCERIKRFRPELDVYYVTDSSLDQTDSEILSLFRRIFYRQEDVQEAHLSIRKGISDRFEAPFFKALVDYSKRPTGVFHAMPISRGNSVFKSNWIKEMGDFYGRNIFLAETSATTGGLDSLLQPTGPLKKAQQLAAKAFGAQQTYFATNGTSTANKIVLQGMVRPGDIVLVDRDCHKSHHYALMLSGAFPVYLDSYPIQQYSMYGAVPLKEITRQLLLLKQEGRLHKVKMLILTNCTFDGVVYNVQQVMEAVLAIKPDMIFLWDEAWFGFAYFTQFYRHRTGMWSAKELYDKFHSEAYRKKYEAQKSAGQADDMVDPDQVKIRVYSTQSTHKTLSSLRQGSMIHIWDEDFRRKAEDSFNEAYMTHTSTSANYQILASLDVGRRQTVFEGYEMVEKSVEMSMALREKIINNPILQQYFKVLTIEDIIPDEYRKSSLVRYYDPRRGWSHLEEGWLIDEFVLDPTKINLYIGNTGVNGDTFKNRYLMDQFGIQVNKTTRNSVLFMANIGTTRSSVAYLTGVLLKIALQLQEEERALNREELALKKAEIVSLSEDCPPLPDFSAFHPSFKPNQSTPEGDLRKAYYMVYDEENCEYRTLEACDEAISNGEVLVSASFVIPYPPGFPVLVPGQVVSAEILDFMMKLDVKEIHGYRPALGLRLFTQSALEMASPDKQLSTADHLS